MRLFATRGVDHIITDLPDLAREVIAEHESSSDMERVVLQVFGR